MINNIWNFVSGSSPPSNPNSPSVSIRGRSSTPSLQWRKPEYSLSYLQSQVDELISIAGNAESPRSAVPASSTDRLVEVTRAIAETLLWGEQNEEDSQMFDYFCEKGVMKIFAALLNSPTIPPSSGIFSASSAGNRQIKIQLLQTMSLLLLNVKRETSLYFLFSNNAVNQLINNNNHLDFSDEEILSYYVSLIKSISLRMSRESVQFFINEKNANYFPLFSQSIRFFDHHDRMVRIAVRTITLSIFKLYDSNKILEKFINENSGGYFSLLACQLRDLWYLMDRTINSSHDAAELVAESTLSVVADEMVDQLEYLAEIQGLGISTLSDMMWSKMEAYAIEGVLIKGLLGITLDGSESPKLEEAARASKSSSPAPLLSGSLSLFVFIQFVEVFRLCPISESLIAQFVTQDKSRIEAELKNVGSSYSCLVMVFIKLFGLSLESAQLKDSLSEFGILPPRSIELTILVAQSLAKSLDRMSLRQIQLSCYFLRSFLQSESVEEEFKRPVRLTVIDSFRTASTKVAHLFSDSLIRPLPKVNLSQPPPISNTMDYALIDLFDQAISEMIRSDLEDSISRTSSDVNLLVPGSESQEWALPEDSCGKELNLGIVRRFMAFTQFVKRVVQIESFDPHLLYEQLFDSCEYKEEIEPINSPFSPPPELLLSESSNTTTVPIPHNLPEESSIDLGRRDRIVCTHLTSPLGRSTRFLIVDKFQVILVAPDLTRPGFATVKYVEKLRRFSSISIYREDQRILILQLWNGSEQQLGFDDMKRCHLALMHLETKRMEIRKNVFRNIEGLLRKFIHIM